MMGSKKMKYREILVSIILSVTFYLNSSPVFAQAFPSKPIKIVLPFAPGGAMDAVARPISDSFFKITGQPLVIENLGGAGGTIGANQVSRSAPDGYSILMGSNGQISIAPFVNPALPYDPSVSLVPIIHIANSPAILYASAKSPYKTLQDVIDDAKRRPGIINFAHPGNGSLGHLTLKLFSQQAGVRFTHVPYKGAGQALVDVASGEIPLIFTHVSTAQPFVSNQMVRPLAVASEKRFFVLNDVPTFSELGFPNLNISLWLGLMAPKGTSSNAIDVIAKTIDTSLKTNEMKSRLALQGFEITGGSPDAFKNFIAEDTERWRKLSKTVDLNEN